MIVKIHIQEQLNSLHEKDKISIKLRESCGIKFLSSPLRTCAKTMVRQPKSFLIPYTRVRELHGGCKLVPQYRQKIYERKGLQRQYKYVQPGIRVDETLFVKEFINNTITPTYWETYITNIKEEQYKSIRYCIQEQQKNKRAKYLLEPTFEECMKRNVSNNKINKSDKVQYILCNTIMVDTYIKCISIEELFNQLNYPKSYDNSVTKIYTGILMNKNKNSIANEDGISNKKYILHYDPSSLLCIQPLQVWDISSLMDRLKLDLNLDSEINSVGILDSNEIKYDLMYYLKHWVLWNTIYGIRKRRNSDIT